MDRDALKAALQGHVKEIDGHQSLSCHRAHVMAEDLGVELQQIGQICHEEQIKIVDCQLGCFGGGSHA